MPKNEIRRLEAKRREWDEDLREWDKKQRKFWRGCRKKMKNFFNWYFFYEPKDDGDRAYHIIMWLAGTIIILRGLGVI